MADARTKARRGAVKDIKQGKYPEDNLVIPHKKKKKSKPYKVIGELFNREICWHESATEEEAQAWIEKQKRSYQSLSREKYKIEYKE